MGWLIKSRKLLGLSTSEIYLKHIHLIKEFIKSCQAFRKEAVISRNSKRNQHLRPGRNSGSMRISRRESMSVGRKKKPTTPSQAVHNKQNKS